MRTIANATLALGFVGAMAIGTTAAVKAQGFERNVPGVHVHSGRHHYNYPDQRYYDYAPGGPSDGGHPRWNGICPPSYVNQGGICKPYRGN
jgi:hypothetical protein